MPVVVERTPLTLAAYRMLTGAGTPLARHFLEHRLKRGKENPLRLGERRGEPSAPRPTGPMIWVHGASVGEFTAVLPLIERIRGRGINVLMTTGTVTSSALAEKRLPPGAFHQFLPLDVPAFITRFLDYWRPDLALFVESDLWPNMIVSAAERAIPLILVNGRLSERSFNRWRHFPKTIAALLRRFDLCLVRSAGDAERFNALGAPRLNVTGNLKYDVPAPPADVRRLAALTEATCDRIVVVAASTHPGEESVMVDVHRRLETTFPELLTVIAPRHPARGAAVAEIAAAARLSSSLRSRGALPDRETGIYVSDTLGELGALYRLAPIVFMGGSLVRHGGQNPIEAIKLGAAILHGPHVSNFEEIYRELDRSGGAGLVTDAGTVALRTGAWIEDGAERESVAAAGLRCVDRLGGALDCTVAALEPYFMQLRIANRTVNA
jgi:3-deoxy-D-manno-octulosonic-acid transferase